MENFAFDATYFESVFVNTRILLLDVESKPPLFMSVQIYGTVPLYGCDFC